jgi:hypothetical protein
MPVLRLTREALAELLDYSASLPTGKTLGKRWKCDAHLRDRDRLAHSLLRQMLHGPSAIVVKSDGPTVRHLSQLAGELAWMKLPALWLVGEYAPHENPELVKINWYRAEVADA